MIVTNLVHTCRIGSSIDLPLLYTTLEGARFEPNRFRGLILRCEKGTCLVFHNGQLVIVGVKTRAEALSSRLTLVNKLRKCGQNVNYNEPLKLKNIVAYHSYGVPVDLVALYNSLRYHYNISYEPEISPAALLKLPGTVRIFHNGKVVFTGFKNFNELDKAFEKLNILLREPTSLHNAVKD